MINPPSIKTDIVASVKKGNKVYNFHYHPEAKEGEVWLTNSTGTNFGTIGWKTKRLGVVAYNADGTPIKRGPLFDIRPVFIMLSEMQEAFQKSK